MKSGAPDMLFTPAWLKERIQLTADGLDGQPLLGRLRVPLLLGLGLLCMFQKLPLLLGTRMYNGFNFEVLKRTADGLGGGKPLLGVLSLPLLLGLRRRLFGQLFWHWLLGQPQLPPPLPLVLRCGNASQILTARICISSRNGASGSHSFRRRSRLSSAAGYVLSIRAGC